MLHTSKAVEKISEGEIFQIQKSRDLDLNEKDYYNIISRKTGSLFACCFQLQQYPMGFIQRKKWTVYIIWFKIWNDISNKR